MFAKVIIDLPIEDTFWFSIDKSKQLNRFQRVVVPFSGGEVVGVVIDTSEDPKDKKLGKVIRVIDKEEVFTETQFELAKFISYYYTSTLSEALFTMIPNSSRINLSKLRTFIQQTIVENTELTVSQTKVYEEVKNSLGSYKVFVLYGIAGSGKTEIYKKLVRDVLNIGKSALLLVPEISLTPQLVDKFSFIPKDMLAVYHSRLTDNERFNIYISVKKGLKKFVIGPRSSILLPFKDLGIVIIDEFHETSYKSSTTPRYSTKEVAKWLCKYFNIPLLLGSATPPVEDFYLAKNGVYKLLELKEKFSKYQKVDVEIIDSKKLSPNNVIAPEVISLVSNKIKQNQQVIVFINRRGFSNFIKCNNCGYIPMCPNCDITLTYHKYTNSLECHHCGHKEKYEAVCKKCRAGKMVDVGSGTEKAEEIIRNLFYNKNIIRVDLDTTRDKGIYDKIYKSLRDGDIDVIVGTQIISKGLDIPQVNLVCVLFPEITLRIPDFYSAERTFSLVMQAIGRAGRRDEKGLAIIQTSDTEHYSIRTAVEQDYESFYSHEIQRRETYKYPPFWRITRFVFRSEIEKNCIEVGKSAKVLLDGIAHGRDDIVVSSLLPAPITKISGNYRHQIIVKSKDEQILTRAQEIVYKNLRNKMGVYIEIDRDPVSLM
ncbi:MAG: primosomal protein N' [Spirochaetia bacterium]|nr:primosomal protein N' [Spirochaetota bacterium]MDW8112007.1 primosomal protein N' [Spirochaetia bacterium]